MPDDIEDGTRNQEPELTVAQAIRAFGVVLDGLDERPASEAHCAQEIRWETIGTWAFGQWLAARKAPAAAAVDKNADLIASTLGPLAKAGRIRIPRGGYLVKRGRGRVIVTRGTAG